MCTKLEKRSWIKTEVAQGRSRQECFQGLREACGDAALLYRIVAHDVLTRSEKAGMPFRTTSVQDDQAWRTSTVLTRYESMCLRSFRQSE